MACVYLLGLTSNIQYSVSHNWVKWDKLCSDECWRIKQRATCCSMFPSTGICPQVEVGFAVGRLLALKEDDEVINMKKAAFLAAGIMQNFVLKQLERAIEEDSSITHATLSRMTLEAISDPNSKA